MSNTKHTPGPYRADKVKIEKSVIKKRYRGNLYVKDSFQIAVVYGETKPELIANLKLFEAAPELLEALKELISLAPDHFLLPTDFDNDLKNAIKKGEATLKKATE